MASGDTLVAWGATDAISATATFGTRAMATGQVPELTFAAAGTTYAIFQGIMPRHYAGGGFTVTLGWMATSATTNAVVWEAAFKSVTDDADDLDTKTFAAVNTVSGGAATTASASGEVDYATITFTDGADADSVAAGEYFQFYVSRNGDSGSDTMADTAELVFVEIRET